MLIIETAWNRLKVSLLHYLVCCVIQRGWGPTLTQYPLIISSRGIILELSSLQHRCVSSIYLQTCHWKFPSHRPPEIHKERLSLSLADPTKLTSMCWREWGKKHFFCPSASDNTAEVTAFQRLNVTKICCCIMHWVTLWFQYFWF